MGLVLDLHLSTFGRTNKMEDKARVRPRDQMGWSAECSARAQFAKRSLRTFWTMNSSKRVIGRHDRLGRCVDEKAI